MNLLRNNRGSALTMVMIVGLGTLAIIGGSMKKMSIGKKQVASDEIRKDEKFIWDQVKGMVSSKQTCLNTFTSLPAGSLTNIQTANDTVTIAVDQIRLADTAKTVVFSKNSKMSNRIELQGMYLKKLGSPVGNTFQEKEKPYNGPVPQADLISVIRTGVFVTELKNLRTNHTMKKEIDMRFTFQNNILVECYGIEEKDEVISTAISDQCKGHGGTFNPVLKQCEFGDGKPLFSTVDNNSVLCQMDKDRILGQGYANPSFCPNSYQWGGCIWNGTILASQESTVYKTGKMAGGIYAFKTSKKVNFNDRALVASLVVGGPVATALLGAFTGVFNWCEKKEYYICAKCFNGKIELNEYKYRYQKKKRLSCKWRTAYDYGCG